MANTSFHGKGGSVLLGAETIGNLRRWSLEVQCDTADSTAMGNENDYRSHLAGFKDWTARVEANLSSTAADVTDQLALLGTTVTCVFSSGTGKPSLSGTGIVTGFRPTSESGATATVAFTVQGSGALTAGTGS